MSALREPVAATPQPAASGHRYVVGVDFGTLSGRAVVVDTADGRVLGSAVTDYPHGVLSEQLPESLTSSGPVALAPDWALQVPEDYRAVLREAVPAAVADAGIDPGEVVGIATDFTASSPLPVTADGTPLSELDGFRDRPHAYLKLWRHHAAQDQADRINALARERDETWLPRYGGKISSEWEWAKALQVVEQDPEVWAATERWIEAADWIVWQLTGSESRNVCTAGYKAIRQDGHYPSVEFAAALHPDLADFVATRLEHPLSPLGSRVGGLSAQAAGWTGLPAGIAVAAGNVDAHVTLPAAQSIESGSMLAIMGTSTCHVMNADRVAEVAGMCGVVDGGITPGAFGYEAGQSGVGTSWGGSSTSRSRRATTSRPRSAGSVCTQCSPSSPGSRPSANTASWPWTGIPATARSWSTTNCPAWWSGRRWPPPRSTSIAR